VLFPSKHEQGQDHVASQEQNPHHNFVLHKKTFKTTLQAYKVQIISKKLSSVFPFLLIVVGWFNTLTTLFIFTSFGFALLT
jgi:uncharacterized membrane protein